MELFSKLRPPQQESFIRCPQGCKIPVEVKREDFDNLPWKATFETPTGETIFTIGDTKKHALRNAEGTLGQWCSSQEQCYSRWPVDGCIIRAAKRFTENIRGKV